MLTVLLLSVFGTITALNPVVVKGTKLYDSVSKERFMMRGVAYAPSKYFNAAAGGNSSLTDDGADLLDDAHEFWWSRDIPFLQALNVNVVRIYEIDSSKPHGKIMKALEDAGIYVILGLTTSVGGGALQAGTPSPGCFSAPLMDSVESIITNMGIYSNLLAFAVGNEVENEVPLFGTEPSQIVRGYLALPCVKALARDARKFMRSCPNMRNIPLLYAATDYANPTKQIIADYLACDQTESGGAIDIYGVNVYTWCAATSTVRMQSSYGVLVDQFQQYNIPLILSEFGCNQGDFASTYANNWTEQRTWRDAGPVGLFSNEMKDEFSGGAAFQYSMTANNYGLVLLPGYQANQSAVVLLPNYYNLQEQFTLAKNLQAQWNETGTWTTADQCTWTPVQGRASPACPSEAVIESMFESGPNPINTTQYPPSIWYDLPTLSRSSIPCVTSSGPIPVKCTLMSPTPPTPPAPSPAPTPGNCSAIEKLSNCSIELTSLNGTQIQKLFDNMCGMFAQQYAPDLNWCSTTFDGSYQACTAQEKIDYALLVWFQWAAECCVSLKDSMPCTPLVFPTAAPSRAPASTETSPTGHPSVNLTSVVLNSAPVMIDPVPLLTLLLLLLLRLM